ncbi:integrase core domain-containing protein [Actinoplanes sp. DH11]|uniref:integrase core domain-containing protein n=1 Tax=Actinoplanes sp. DH11 TaxID=2857011 RepID=UPI001E378D42|nr:integrase core domain-containing protein [Actinoplanes sp. DH11]
MRTCWAEQVGRDGYLILYAVTASGAPGWLREIPQCRSRLSCGSSSRCGRGPDVVPHYYRAGKLSLGFVLACSFNSLFKAELVRNKGPWRGLDDLEMATVEYIDWYNDRRLHGELGHVPPAEHEALHAMTHPVTAPLETS